MKRLLLLILLLCGSIHQSATARRAAAQSPSYLILRAPAQSHRGHAYYPGRGYEVKPQTYAYGWFGAQPRSHWKRHTGYYSNYIQWSKK
jgi:hypothetical protein